MHTEEHPLRAIAHLSWQPTLLALTRALVVFVNTILIAQLGTTAIAAVTIAGNVALIQAAVYASVGTSLRYVTATTKTTAERSRWIVQGIFFAATLGLVLGLATVSLTTTLFDIYDLPITASGKRYLQVVGGSCMVPAIFAAIVGGLQGIKEQQKLITKASLVMCFAELLLNLLLIAWLHQGLFGAACATVLSSLLGSALILGLFWRWAKPDLIWKLNWGMQKELYKKAIPLMYSSLSNELGMVLPFAMLSRTGTETLAAVRILYVVKSVFYETWMSGLLATISPNVGPIAKREQAVVRYVRWVLGVAVIGTVVSYLLQLVLGRAIVGLFSDDEAVIQLSFWMILLYAGINGFWVIAASISEVLGVYRQTKTASMFVTLSSVVLVIGCVLVGPSVKGIILVEAVQYLFWVTAAVAYFCGYYKRAGIPVLALGELRTSLIHRLRPKKQVEAPPLTQSQVQTRLYLLRRYPRVDNRLAERLNQISLLEHQAEMDFVWPLANAAKVVYLHQALCRIESIRRLCPAWRPVEEVRQTLKSSLRATLVAIESAGEQKYYNLADFMWGYTGPWHLTCLEEMFQRILKSAEKRLPPANKLEDIKKLLIEIRLLGLPELEESLQQAIAFCVEENPSTISV